MEVHFTADTEAKLQRFAASAGKPAGQLVEETMRRILREREEYLAAVEKGIEQADRGELIEHDEVMARIERLLKS